LPEAKEMPEHFPTIGVDNPVENRIELIKVSGTAFESVFTYLNEDKTYCQDPTLYEKVPGTFLQGVVMLLEKNIFFAHHLSIK
jgi:hypothetical protein